MGGKEVQFYIDDVCDICGQLGAFDFYGDLICPDCCEKYLIEEDDETDTGGE